MHEHHKEIAVLYHGGCPDGFGGAYAAWKKFGDAAEYIPLKYGYPAPKNLAGKKLYFIDFCYKQEIMDALVPIATHVTVLDHHLGTKGVVESMPEYVFDEKRSGATIAWNYFHSDVSVPTLLQYVQDGDLYTFSLPDSHAVLAYCYAQPFHFETWATLSEKLENTKELHFVIERGKIYAEYFAILVEQIANKATLISFEGFECYLVGASGMFSSSVGNLLARMKPPIGIVVNVHADMISVSLRSDISVDVSAIARKYGGNGHPQAAGFELRWGDPVPWTVITKNENSSD